MSDLNADTIDRWRNQLDAALEALKPIPAKKVGGKTKVRAQDARERLQQLAFELRESWLDALQK